MKLTSSAFENNGKITLNLSEQVTKQQVLKAIEGQVLARSVLIGRYERQ